MTWLRSYPGQEFDDFLGQAEFNDFPGQAEFNDFPGRAEFNDFPGQRSWEQSKVASCTMQLSHTMGQESGLICKNFRVIDLTCLVNLS